MYNAEIITRNEARQIIQYENHEDGELFKGGASVKDKEEVEQDQQDQDKNKEQEDDEDSNDNDNKEK